MMIPYSNSNAVRVRHAVTPGEHGNLIHELLQDYGSGWLRMYRFLPRENRAIAITFNPRTEELCQGTKLVPDRAAHQFEFEIPALAAP